MNRFIIPSTIMFLIIGAIILSISIILPSIYAEESYKGKGITITISKSCLMNGDKCLTYDKIKAYDNSDEKITGKIITKAGKTYREPTKFQNSYRFYNYDNQFRLIIDPPAQYDAHFQTIEIIPKLDSYYLKSQMRVNELKYADDMKATKSVRIMSTDRYVDSTCTHAVISAKNWKILLPDTINYLKNNCDPKSTSINTVKSVVKDLVQHDIGTSAKWKYDDFSKTVKDICSKQYGVCKDVQNKAVTTNGDVR